jgi:predicted transcriptional regulator
MSYMGSLTIRIADKLRRELDRLSREKRRSVNDLVRESLRRYIVLERFRSLRRKAVPFARSQGFLVDEDVYKAVS